MYKEEVDIILGSTWMETLKTFILDMKKRFLTFCYEKKKITLHNFSMTSNLETPSSKDFKHV